MAKGRKKAGSKKQQAQDRQDLLEDMRSPGTGGLDTARRQLRTAAKAAVIAVVVIWALAVGFYSGLDSSVPLYVAAGLTAAGVIAALLIRRNLGKSEALGALVSGSADLSDEERAAQLAKLDKKVAKGDATAVLAKAQLQMQDSPEAALETLESVDLAKAQKLVAAQIRAMRSMINLNLGNVKPARELVDEIDLSKAPDAKMRANLAAVIAEAWARSGNPIEAKELLDKYDPDDEQFSDIRMQLLRARVFQCAHKHDIKGMRRALKQLMQISPQLAGMFIGQKRIHPLLQKEARRVLEKSGIARTKFQVARR